MKNFNEIYATNYKMILGFVIRKVNDLQVAEELTNDIFMKVYNHLHNFDSEKSAMRTWIMNITSNTVIDYYRKKKLETISLNKDFDNGEDKSTSLIDKFVCHTPTPYEALNSKGKMSKIDNVISELSKSEFEVAYYYFKEELTYQEIADVMQINLGTVKAKLSRARKSLQAKLELI